MGWGDARYKRLLAKILLERGAVCEACGVPAYHAHHIIPVSETSIASPLVFEPANLIVLCNECHSLMHPLIRNIAWNIAGINRGRALNRLH